jgi:hypothetical protein
MKIFDSNWTLDNMNYAYVHESGFEIWPSVLGEKKDGKIVAVSGWSIGFRGEGRFIYFATSKTKEEVLLECKRFLSQSKEHQEILHLFNRSFNV